VRHKLCVMDIRDLIICVHLKILSFLMISGIGNVFKVVYLFNCRTVHWVIEHLSKDRLIYDPSVDRSKCQFVEDNSVPDYFRSRNTDYKVSLFKIIRTNFWFSLVDMIAGIWLQQAIIADHKMRLIKHFC
jgi:hypothetical protein